MEKLHSWVLVWLGDPAAGGGADHEYELHDLSNHQRVPLPVEAGRYVGELHAEHAAQSQAISALRMWAECLLSGLPDESARQRALEACQGVEGGSRGGARLCLEIEMAQILGDLAGRVSARGDLGMRLRRVLAEAARAGLVPAPAGEFAGEIDDGRLQAEEMQC